MEFKSVRIPAAEIESQLAAFDKAGWEVVSATFHEYRRVVGAYSNGQSYAFAGGGGAAYGGHSGGEMTPIYGDTVREFVVILRRPDVSSAHD